MPADGRGFTRAIDATSLRAGDILFKHASMGMISQRIKAGQKSHYRQALTNVHHASVGRDSSQPNDAGREVVAPSEHDRVSDAPSQEEAIDITHVALALGANDVVEFDEGGASKWEIVARGGYGFVRGPMRLPSRLGKTYEIYRCTSEGLWSKAAEKAALVWDLTHASPEFSQVQGKTPLTGSYGVTKMLQTALRGKKGPDVTLRYFEKTLDEWLSAADRKNLGHRANTNLQFFCSNFVLYCYLWAAAEWQEDVGTVGGLDYILGTKAAIAPVELYVRVRAGQKFFRYAGTLAT